MARATRALPIVLGPVVLAAAAAVAQGVPKLDSYNGVAVRILQSNNAGPIHHIIEPATNRQPAAHNGLACWIKVSARDDGSFAVTNATQWILENVRSTEVTVLAGSLFWGPG
jgi:hypothetical protein